MGTAETKTRVLLAAVLATQGKTLLIDVDPQASSIADLVPLVHHGQLQEHQSQLFPTAVAKPS